MGQQSPFGFLGGIIDHWLFTAELLQHPCQEHEEEEELEKEEPTFNREHGAGDSIESLVRHLAGLVQLNILQGQETLSALRPDVTCLMKISHMMSMMNTVHHMLFLPHDDE